jgi:hypothetical protein
LRSASPLKGLASNIQRQLRISIGAELESRRASDRRPAHGRTGDIAQSGILQSPFAIANAVKLKSRTPLHSEGYHLVGSVWNRCAHKPTSQWFAAAGSLIDGGSQRCWRNFVDLTLENFSQTSMTKFPAANVGDGCGPRAGDHQPTNARCRLIPSDFVTQFFTP